MKLPYSFLTVYVWIFKYHIFAAPVGLYISLPDRLYMILIPNADLLLFGLNALTLYVRLRRVPRPFGLYLYLDHSFF